MMYPRHLSGLTIPAAACLAVLVAGPAPGLVAGPADSGPTAIVGLAPAPPFAMQEASGDWQGIAVDLWRQVAADLGLRFEFRALGIARLIAGLQSGGRVALGAGRGRAARRRALGGRHPR